MVSAENAPLPISLEILKTGFRDEEKKYSGFDVVDPVAMTCLTPITERWEQEKPFAGKKILLNAHIAGAVTLKLIYQLCAGGAEVEVIRTDALAFDPDTAAVLRKSGIKFYEPSANTDGPLKNLIPENQREDYYDIVMDCGGALSKFVIPKLGAVELTHVEPDVYAGVTYPVVSVDLESDTKKIETFFGTGDGIKRAVDRNNQRIQECFDKSNGDVITSVKEVLGEKPDIKTILEKIEDILKVCENKRNSSFKNIKTWLFGDSKQGIDAGGIHVIFGYGKVGQGIANALIERGVKPQSIVVIDNKVAAKRKAEIDGFTAHLLNMQETAGLKNIKDCLKKAHVVYTATGVEGVVSQYFERKDFADYPIFVNAGTYNEFGQHFPPAEILNNGKPANFELPEPTKPIHLVPSLACYAIAAELLASPTTFFKAYPNNEGTKNLEKIPDGMFSLPASAEFKVGVSWWAQQHPHTPLHELLERTHGFYLKTVVEQPSSVSPSFNYTSSRSCLESGETSSNSSSPTNDYQKQTDILSRCGMDLHLGAPLLHQHGLRKVPSLPTIT